MKILVVAEAPGQEEDKQNTQLIGPAEQVLRKALEEFGIDLDRDCRKTNAVRCRPPSNRRPIRQEIDTCQPYIWNEIAAQPPKLILLLGQVAVESFLSSRIESPGAIGRWRGFAIPDQKAQAWVCPTFHPSYILRSQHGRAIRGKFESDVSIEERIFMADLENALTHLKKPFPAAPIPTILDDWTIQKGMEIAIDYETTGLRPWGQKDHKIVSLGISTGEWCSSVAMTNDFADKWKLILQAKDISKIGHNIKFEHQWAAHCLGTETQGWKWDTMLAAHLADNRRGICGLKHQAYLNFGVENWGKEIDFEETENDIPFANVQSIEELLRYNALDAFWTFQLAQKQMKLFQ